MSFIEYAYYGDVKTDLFFSNISIKKSLAYYFRSCALFGSCLPVSVTCLLIIIEIVYCEGFGFTDSNLSTEK